MSPSPPAASLPRARHAALAAALVLCACPEERADTRSRVPAGRVPAAVPLEAAPAAPGEVPRALPANAAAAPPASASPVTPPRR